MPGTRNNYFKRAFRHNMFISACGEWKVIRGTNRSKTNGFAAKHHKWDLYSICTDGSYEYVESFPSMDHIKQFINIDKEIYA